MKYNNLIKRNGLEVNKVTIKGTATIIYTPLGQFVVKNNKGTKIYDYLLSRGFDYFPKIIDYDNDVILFEYIENIEYDSSEKAQDFIKLLSFLHTKTSFFKEIDINEYKSIYEDTKYKIMSLFDYYNNLVNIIESHEYMSPSEYLLIKNISIIFSALNYCQNELNQWFDLVSKKSKKRVATLFNNIDLNNLIKSKDNIYFIGLDKAYVNIPVYDLYDFYNKYFNDFDFPTLLTLYEKVFKLTEDEKKILFIFISIPNKIEINNNIENIKYIKTSIKKIYNTLEVLNFEKEKTGETHKTKDN